jgi:hypothetical protein
MFYICIDRVYVPRPLRKTTPCDGLPYPKLAAELPKSTMSAKPQAHATKWTVVVGLDRPTVRLFSDQAKAETERDFHVQHGRQAYLLPPVAASSGTSVVDGTLAHVRDQLKALYACVGLLAVEKDPQELYAGMVDAADILEDLAKAMLEAGLAKDENTSEAQV